MSDYRAKVIRTTELKVDLPEFVSDPLVHQPRRQPPHAPTPEPQHSSPVRLPSVKRSQSATPDDQPAPALKFPSSPAGYANTPVPSIEELRALWRQKATRANADGTGISRKAASSPAPPPRVLSPVPLKVGSPVPAVAAALAQQAAHPSPTRVPLLAQPSLAAPLPASAPVPRVVTPPLPLPPLMPATDTLDGVEPPTVPQIPLDLFDSPTMENEQPDDWLKRSAVQPVPAQSRYFEKHGDEFDMSWVPCVVLAYDRDLEKYLIEFVEHQHQQKYVTRLNLKFDAEKESHYAERVANAARLKEDTEMRLRKEMLINGQPDSVVAPLRDDQLSALLLALGGEKMSPQLIASLRYEVQQVYTHAVKRAVFDYVHRGAQSDTWERLRVPALPTPVPAPYQGIVQVPKFGEKEYRERLEAVQESAFVGKSILLTTLAQVQALWENFSEESVIDVNCYSMARPYALEEWLRAQKDRREACLLRLSSQWVVTVAQAMASALEQTYSFEQHSMATFMQSPLFHFLQLVGLRMNNQLSALVQRSIDRYMATVCNHVPDPSETELLDQVERELRDVSDEKDAAMEARHASNIEESKAVGKAAKAARKKQKGREKELSDSDDEAAADVAAKEHLEELMTRKEVFDPTTVAARLNPGWRPAMQRLLTLAPRSTMPFLTARLSLDAQDEYRMDPTAGFIQSALVDTPERSVMSVQNIARPDLSILHGIDMRLYPHQTLHIAVSTAKHEKAIQEVVEAGLRAPRLLIGVLRMLDGLRTLDENVFRESLRNSKAPLKDMHNMAQMFLDEANVILEQIPSTVGFTLLDIDLDDVKTALVRKTQRLHMIVLSVVAEDMQQELRATAKSFEGLLTSIEATPSCAEELRLLDDASANCLQRTRELEEHLAEVQRKYEVLEQFCYPLQDDDFTLYYDTKGWPKHVGDYRTTVLPQRVQQFRKEFMSDLTEEQTVFNRRLVKIGRESQKLVALADIEEAEANDANLKDFMEELRSALDGAKRINAREEMFGWERTDFSQLTQTAETMEPFSQLWNIAGQVEHTYPEWLDGAFSKLDHEKIANLIEKWSIALYKLARQQGEVPHCVKVAQHYRSKLEDFKQHLPLIQSLRNPGMKDRHWTAIFERTGLHLKPKSTLTLSRILEMGIRDHLDALTEIADAAAKEFSLEKALQKMLQETSKVNFDCLAYKETGTFVLRGTDEVLVMLDDQLVTTQTIRGSPFIKPLESEAKKWERTLRMLMDIMEEWLQCQRTWMYLEPIFSSPDINRQLPVEGTRFAEVDALWRGLMGAVQKNPAIMVVYTTQENLLKRLKDANKKLDEIQKGLNDYLEMKRAGFPRFYFLSNDELLSILSQTKEVKAVQPHLPKCFENIHKLTFEQDNLITAMHSVESEVIPFVEPVRPEGNVEMWLMRVEAAMKSSLRDTVKRALADYPSKLRRTWVVSWPGQVVLAGSQIEWTRGATEAMQSTGLRGLRTFETQLNRQLETTVKLVRGDLTPLNRLTLGALVVIDVHARDVISRLVTAGVEADDDFEWTSQLRYYWVDDDISVRMVNTARSYGYEYLGNSARLVITPLTDRCYMTLMGALHLNLGGAPAGPAGTGKTETTKDLAKALAKQCVVFNCSDGLDYLAMGKFFKGLAQAGAWACFDEFNRIDIEVLSVIGQQILTIQTAIIAKQKRFIFEGTDIPLDPTCAVFITMNPGYAGRTELPDNLKALFRPVAMMIPDYALISEISLYSFGFSDARPLAQKIVATFRLSSEQLSSQDHYDFGMRAVKSVLTAAGNLKRAFPEEQEDVLILRAINDVNVPKFLSDDLPLFTGITGDLFPNVTVPSPDYNELNEALQKALATANMQCTPTTMRKCIQLYETIGVRHGLMLVGQPLAGKTTVLRTLAAAMRLLQKKGIPTFQKVLTYTINPKSITMGELYGQFDAVSHEWSDGVLCTTVRNCASSATPEMKWVVFDGPVDAVWIENMNTVLDDNKKLCLNSGEIIKLSPQMTMMFEVGDLAVASPATVSRCGMVYMEPSQLGWRPLMQSWLVKQPKLVENPDLVPSVVELFEWLLDPALYFVRRHCSEPVPTSDSSLAMSMLHVYGSLLVDVPESTHDAMSYVDSQFVFALVWSVGAAIDERSRQPFDDFLHRLLQSELTISDVKPQKDAVAAVQSKARKLTLPLPDKGSLYDFMYDAGRRAWVPWANIMPNAAIEKDAAFHDIFVPTVDSTRYTFLLELLVTHGHHVLVTGPTGTGKTVLIKQRLQTALPQEYVPVFLSFSAQATAGQTQEIIESKLDKRRNTLAPPMGQKFVIFVDDLNMPARETYGAQPPIELLRQWMDHSGWYDRKSTVFTEVIDIQFVAAMGPPGGGRNPITNRYTRHFNQIYFSAFAATSLAHIFNTIMDWWLAQLPALSSQGKSMVDATIEIYQTIAKELLPTPAKSHYTFNLRDLAKVFQGVLSAHVPGITDALSLTRLWAHECFRVFSDRLVEDTDRKWFKELMNKMLQQYFRTGIADIEGRDDDAMLLYGDFMRPMSDARPYEHVANRQQLIQTMEGYLEDFNQTSRKPMDLVLFLFAIEHVARISRIIRQPFGHALLVGVGGSGRQSLTTLAAFMGGYALHRIEVSKQYGSNEWREDLKIVMRMAGVEGKPVVFLLNDTQIIKESFLEDVNNILNTGEVPNLFPADEMSALIEELLPVARDAGAKTTRTAVYAFFVQRCRSNIHVVLCMSPAGEAFRNRLRMFPSLVNCCTIDWFAPWPEQALRSVALRFLSSTPGIKSVPDIAEMCVLFHQTTAELSAQYLQELRRHNFVTPTSYLELISTFKTILAERQHTVSSAKSRYETGVEKLVSAAKQVAEMEQELIALQPVLVTSTAETEAMMVRINHDQEEAAQIQEVVSADRAAAIIKADEARAIRDQCDSELAIALPALQAAEKALATLNKGDISEVKAMKAPPDGVKLVMSAVCIMLGVPPVKKPPAQPGGKKIDDFWPAATRILGDANFLKMLIDYDRDNITAETIEKVTPYLKDPKFDPKVIEKVSAAANGLCKWVRAMDQYYRVSKVVAPKRAALKEAEEVLRATQEALALKEAKLRDIEDRLNGLKMQLQDMILKKQKLEEQIKLCHVKLERAHRLTGGLGGERQRWTAATKTLGEQLTRVVGDALLAAGYVAYLGAFTAPYRAQITQKWAERLEKLNILTSDHFTLRDTIGDAVRIRDWIQAGLPNDTFSVDNAVIVSRSRRWPLMIDPQGQANKWIKTMLKSQKLITVRLTDNDCMRSLSNAILFGTPVLIENIGQDIDPMLEPLLQRQTFKQAGVLMIRLGDESIEYSNSFSLHMATKLPNPIYPPELATKVCLLNFTITPEGLTDQLLGLVVMRERPDLEEERNELILQSAANRKELKQIEDTILTMLSESKTNVLEDEALIDTLGKSKQASADIERRVVIAEETEAKINKTRQGYAQMAECGSVLFFCIADLANVDSMYQYSLAWYINLYNLVITAAPASDVLTVRLKSLVAGLTYAVYKAVCRSIFERHKLLLSFLMAARLQQFSGELDAAELRFLLTGGTAIGGASVSNPLTWLPEKAWQELQRLNSEPAFTGIVDSVTKEAPIWKTFYDSSDAHSAPLPRPFDKKLTDFQRLLVLRCLRPDKVIPAVQQFIVSCKQLGAKFVEPPQFDLQGAFSDSAAQIPLIFVLSSGADPVSELMRFADAQGQVRTLNSISLGQGQGKIAQEAVAVAVKMGSWVLLQNCHLAVSWMPTLEKIIEELGPQTHPKFRLWLTSMPSSGFPVSILQNGVKMVLEPPQGIRANLLRAYTSMDADILEGCTKQRELRKLMFGLCFFHSVVLERRKFGALGWNIPYEFAASDLTISMRQLRQLLDMPGQVPFPALRYLAGHTNYGGRVTDDWDRRTLLSVLEKFYTPQILDDSYRFSPSGKYYAPDGNKEAFLEYVRTLPLIESPEVFGMHENADITFARNETYTLFSTILALQPRASAGAGKRVEDVIEEVSKGILARLPEPFDIEAAIAKYPVIYEESMNTVVVQELIRFNRLLVIMRSSLVNIGKAIKGLVVMSSELERMANNIFDNQVPVLWAARAYPSLKPLGSWVTDLCKRLAFLQSWLDNGPPAVFWLSGLFFPQAFLTGTLQNYARRHKIPIDELRFDFAVLPSGEPDTPPADGCYINGLFLEGARWDEHASVLAEQQPKELSTPMPPLKLVPVRTSQPQQTGYACPLYKTSRRAGTLSTTGHSTNFIIRVMLPSSVAESHWVCRGAALLCQLDD
eukprot:TRINITY_DN1880_c0_g3_i1.p1 TRINITY_DN1880_c0_g3~~TRINITY_DN1880_c0_g3_i1.p1  ORF type:complete len:4251 (-),score=1210.42 TRINITY_DN1880_c0_g3_i1:76-12828(-)